MSPRTGRPPDEPGVTPADAVLLGLLRAIRRDIAHELRGPVQSVVVNAEVARRRLAAGDAAVAAERIVVIEEEVRRIHLVAEAFVSLLSPPTPEPRIFDVASVLEQVEPLLQVLARAARTGLRRAEPGSAPLVRACPERLAAAIVRGVVAANAEAGSGGEVAIERELSTATVVLRIRATRPAGAEPCSGGALDQACNDLQIWLRPGHGTAALLPGSDPLAPGTLVIRLPRADSA